MAEKILDQVPAELHQLVLNYWQDWQQACATLSQQEDMFRQGLSDTSAVLDLSILGRIWVSSDFVAQSCIRHPSVFLDLLREDISRPRQLSDYTVLVDAATGFDVSDEVPGVGDGQPHTGEKNDEAIMQALRQLRQKEMLRIAWRDLAGLAETAQILYELTDLSEAMVVQVLHCVESGLAGLHGTPVDEQGDAISLVVLAMGKMGGRELNFSSDIDLVFGYAEEGTTGGRRAISHHEFFLKVARKLVRFLNEVTADGFVYRVDTRLRPHGESGPLVMSFAGMEQYYQLQGRHWERYAMIKARMLSGSEKHQQLLQAILQPFIYRRYLDFSAFESIREMKAMIHAQMKRKGMQGDIKLGPGGIREIEFIGQTFQLLRGGREPVLRRRSIVEVLTVLVSLQLLDANESDDLLSAYWFLRQLENRIQMQRDQQVHRLPEDNLSRLRLCVAMAMPDWQQLLQVLAVHQQKVEGIFDELIAPQDTAIPVAPGLQALALFWEDASNAEGVLNWLAELGFMEAEEVLLVLQRFRQATPVKALSAANTGRLLNLLSHLIESSVALDRSVLLIERVLDVLQAIAGRAVYISMLNEYPALQQLLLKLFHGSEWFAQNIARYPLLLDSLLNTSELFSIEKNHQQQLARQLAQLAPVHADDMLEEQMDRLRQFKQQLVFRVAILDVFYQLPVETVGDQLSATAAAILQQVLDIAWQAMLERYGEPGCEIDGKRVKPGLAVIAYGKLGGDELGYGSDLDIIFLHNSSGEKQYTNGESGIDNQRFFARVAQRVVHILSAQTYSGRLYETDTRLRPNGQSGMMVSSLQAFQQYQQEKAWMWEHQALIRARFIAGNAHVEQEFDRIRASVLSQSRSAENVVATVAAMREKMRTHLSSRVDEQESDAFDLKQGAGGLVDIEFMVQAGVLIHAQQAKYLLNSTATLVLIESLQAIGWFTDDEAGWLANAYRYFRRVYNWQSLQCQADRTELPRYAEKVRQIWLRLMSGS